VLGGALATALHPSRPPSVTGEGRERGAAPLPGS
jgi:hypothetical protein